MISSHLPQGFTRFAFTSRRKRMSTIVEKCGDTGHESGKRIHMKGATEIIAQACTHYLNEEG
jgi:magnesium-transporting ATPase (P-type)